MIVLNVLALILETVEPIGGRAAGFFRWFEVFSIAIFSVEYVLRIWSCTESPDYRSPLAGRLRFARTPLAMVDLFAILPFYVPFLTIDLRFIRAVRLFPVFRVAKLGRYSTALQKLSRALSASKEQLLAALAILLLLLVLASSLMYYAEREAQPEAFSSIPATMWWAIVTLTTVGYGDVFPITGWGRMLASVITILGIGMFALPTGILGAAFVDQLRKQKRDSKRCPHCGGQLPD